MKYLIIFALFLSGCANHNSYKVGDCFTTRREGNFKILKMGRYSAVVKGTSVSNQGEYIFDFDSLDNNTTLIDCFGN